MLYITQVIIILDHLLISFSNNIMIVNNSGKENRAGDTSSIDDNLKIGLGNNQKQLGGKRVTQTHKYQVILRKGQ